MINLHIVLNAFENDIRVLKETETIKNMGIIKDVHVAAIMGNGLQEFENDAIRSIWRVQVLTRKLSKTLLVQFVKYFEWKQRIVNKYSKKDLAVVHCHDLNALPVGVALKKKRPSIKLVYDAHELETERNGSKGLRKYLSKIVEKNLIKRCDAMITVSDSIITWYHDNYGIIPILLRNIPKENKISEQSDEYNLKNEFMVHEDEILFIYQGGIAKGRGIEDLISIFKQVDQNKHIVFMGNGPLMRLVNASDNTNNIHYKSAVKSDEVVNYVKSADVGIYLIEDTCLNHRYSLPNKIFEHLQAGIPTIINNLPEQRAIIEDYNAGWIIEEHSGIVDFINAFDVSRIIEKKAGVSRAQKELCWENEEIVLEQLYRKLL